MAKITETQQKIKQRAETLQSLAQQLRKKGVAVYMGEEHINRLIFFVVKEGLMTHSQIAEVLGISRERVGQKYRAYEAILDEGVIIH